MNFEIKIYTMLKGKKALITSAFVQCEGDEIAHRGRELLHHAGEQCVDIHLAWFEVEYLSNGKEELKR